jgi:hypothetical protein
MHLTINFHLSVALVLLIILQRDHFISLDLHKNFMVE